MEMRYGGYVIVMKVKDIRLKVIPSNIANDFVKKYQDIKPTTYKGNSSQVTSIKLDTTKLNNII